MLREAFGPWQTGTVSPPGSSAWTLEFDRFQSELRFYLLSVSLDKLTILNLSLFFLNLQNGNNRASVPIKWGFI